MNKYMLEAIKEARLGIKNKDGGPFGAVIVYEDKIIASAHNCVIKNNDATCHGEIEAIRMASKALNTFDLSGCTLYTTAEPCPMCLGAILWSNISRVYYGCNICDTEDIGFRDKKFYEFDKSKLLSPLDREECLELFKEYKNESKANY